MAVPTLFLSCLLLATLTSAHPPHPLTPTPNSTQDYLDRTLAGLDLAMNFFQREHRNVNLDALIGTRLVQASFTVLLRRLEATGLISQVPAYVIESIKHLRDAARDVTELAMPYVIAAEPDYFASIGPITREGLFELDYASRDIPPDVTLWPYSSRELMKENESDECLAEIFGTRTGKECSLSKACWTQMTTSGYSRYSLSHQIFYLEVAEKFGCESEMRWHMEAAGQPSLSRLHDVFCANMVAESELFAESGFPPKSQDLFMEQAALCGLLGYRDFFNSEWLDRILSWQDEKDGCYRWAAWPLQEHMGASPLPHHHHIAKREEKRVGRGCLCHRTTVAAAALAQYTRYVLEVWLQERGL